MKKSIYEGLVQTESGEVSLGFFSRRKDAAQVVDSVLRELYPDIDFEYDEGYFIMTGTGPGARWFGWACGRSIDKPGTTVELVRGAILFGPNKKLIEDMTVRQKRFNREKGE